MIKLYSFSPSMGVPCPSPFPIKLAVFMQLAGIDYEVVYENNPGKGPKGKIPFIEDQGQLIADSHLIIRHLRDTHIAAGKAHDPDAGLSEQRKAQTLLMQKMLDEHLYWAIVYARWVDPRFKADTGKLLFASMPPLVRNIVFALASRGIAKSLQAQGTGRHEQNEIYRMGCEDIDALATLLGEQDYLFGEQPHSIDAVAFSYVINLLDTPQDVELNRHAQAKENLQAYNRRMKERFYPDFL